MQSVFAKQSPGTDPVVDVGAHVAGYEVLARLRSGGMANLFIARRSGSTTFDELVALKVIQERLSEHSNVVRMFVDEANVTSSIRHPHVVAVKELVEHAGRHILVMEYVHGCSLAALMQALRRNRRRFSPSAAVAIAMRIADGLHAAHELRDDSGQPLNVVHRDVSPQNILFSQHGEVKICDFGVAKAAQHTAESTVGGLKGKIRYMSPEQASTGQVDRRADVYSLALVLWEMLTMRRAFKAGHEFQVLMQVCNPNLPKPSAHSPGISTALDAVVMQALDKVPSRRFESAQAFREALAQAQPRSTAVGARHVAALIDDVMHEEMDAVLRGLPTDLSRVIEHEATLFASAPPVVDSALERLTVAAPVDQDDAEDFDVEDDDVEDDDALDEVSGVDVTPARASSRPPRLPHLRAPAMRDAMAAIAPDLRSSGVTQSSERPISDVSARAERPAPSLPAGAFQAAAASETTHTPAPHAAANLPHNAQMESPMSADPADQFNDDMPTSSIQIDPSLKRDSGYRAAPPAYSSYPRAGATRPTLPSQRPQPQASRPSMPAPRREEEWNPQAIIDEVGLASALPASVPSVREVREMTKKPLFDPKKMTACVDVAPEVMRRAQEMLARGPNPDIMNRPSSELPKGPELKTGKRGGGRPKMPRPEAVKVEQPIPAGRTAAEPGNEQRTRMAERPDEAIAAALSKKTSVTAAPVAAGGAIPLDKPASTPTPSSVPLEQRINKLGKRGQGTMIADRKEFLSKSRANRGSRARNVMIAAAAIMVALAAGVFLSPASDDMLARMGLVSGDDEGTDVEAVTAAAEEEGVGSGPVAKPKRVRKARKDRARATTTRDEAPVAQREQAPKARKAAAGATRSKAKSRARTTRRAAEKAPAKSRARSGATQKKRARSRAADAPAPRRNTRPRQNTRAVDGVPLVRDLSF